MLDHVIAHVDFDPSVFTFDEFTADSRWTITRNAKTDTGEVRWEQLKHVAPALSGGGPSPLTIVLDLKRNRVEVRVTLPRLLCGNNWQAMAESDMPRACRLVDEYLARHLGGLARQLPPFFDWPIRRAEYPHDVFVGSRGAVERWLHALNGQPLHNTSMVGRPYRNSARGYVSGLTWGTKGTRRKTNIYDKFEQCKDTRCPSDRLRIETAVQHANIWEGLRTPEMRAQGRVMTVGEAGTVRVAAQVLEETYDALRLGERAQVGSGDPYPLLIPYYGEKKARTLAGFHAYLMLHGERVSRETYPKDTFSRHLKRLTDAGVSLALTTDGANTGDVRDLPAIPRPTSTYLAARQPLGDDTLRYFWLRCNHRPNLYAPRFVSQPRRMVG